MSGLYTTPKDVLRVLTKLKFRPDQSAEARPGPTVWELPRAVRQKRKTNVSVEVDERSGAWTVYSGETRQQGKGGAQLAKALKGALAEVLPPGRGLKDGADTGKYQPQGVKQKNECRLTEKMRTPQDITSVLSKLKFTFKRGAKVDTWTSPRGKVEVVVKAAGGWTVSYGKNGAVGYGVGRLLKALGPAFEATRFGTNEGELEELTGTGGIAGFGTPYAFATKEPVSGKGKKKTIDEALREFCSLKEGGDPYYPWRNDETQTPKQKIGRAITEINKQLTEVEKVVKRTQRLKKETGTSNNALWNRTNKSLMKIESRMHRISQTIRNMRG